MDAQKAKWIRRLVTYNKVTKFAAKLFQMASKFKQEEVVCLVFDKNKRFIVESGIIVGGKISVTHFDGREIVTCEIDPKYLMHAPYQE